MILPKKCMARLFGEQKNFYSKLPSHGLASSVLELDIRQGSPPRWDMHWRQGNRMHWRKDWGRMF